MPAMTTNKLVHATPLPLRLAALACCCGLLLAACAPQAAAPTAASAPAATTAATKPAAPTTPAGSVSFSQNVLPIFQQRCQSCHSGANAPKGLQLVDYANTMKVVNPVGPAVSKLYEMVQSDLMPRGGPPLSAAEKETIFAWIPAGAPNN